MDNTPVERKIVLAIKQLRDLYEKTSLDTKVEKEYTEVIVRVLNDLEEIELGDFLD